MEQAKITLSQEELELVSNANWILTKNGIMQKANQLLGQIGEQQGAILRMHQEKLPAQLFINPFKISRGENYQGLPYLILDQPRVFDKNHVFAIRTFFWWGNFFSVTLHLSGEYKHSLAEKLIKGYESLADSGAYYCIHTDPWQHHFAEDNYRELKTINAKEFADWLNLQFFVKIARKWSLENWDASRQSMVEHYKMLIGVLV